MADNTLTLSPDPGVIINGSNNYKFYNGQIIILSAKLTRHDRDVTDGELIDFKKIASIQDGVPNKTVELVAYPTNSNNVVDKKNYTVSAPLKRTGYGQGVATLSVLVEGESNISAYVTASTHDKQITSLPLSFEVVSPLIYIPKPQSGIYVPLSNNDLTPKQGKFIYYQFSVLDPESHKPVSNMRVRLSGQAIEGWWITQVAVYSGYKDESPLQWEEDYLGYCVSLETDEFGFAEAFLCPKKNLAAIDNLICKIGPEVEEAGLFAVADLESMQGNVGNPYPHLKNDSIQIDGDDTFRVFIPKYRGSTDSDDIYLFCNEEFQGSPDSVDLSRDPIGHVNVPTCGLFSISYDEFQPENTFRYIVVQSDVITVSSKGSYQASGSLPPANLPPCSGGESAPAPSVPQTPDDWPLNCQSISGGLSIRIPLSSLDVKAADGMVINICLNGYRENPDKKESRGNQIHGPFNFRVTPHMLHQGYAEWWFQSSLFMGYGQSTAGDPGSFQVQYRISSGRDAEEYTNNSDLSQPPPIYCSDVLSLGLDTIPPSGNNGNPSLPLQPAVLHKVSST